MPIMDGATFLQELRREFGAAIPLAVVMSGMPGAENLRSGSGRPHSGRARVELPPEAHCD
jgi:CheY-like chemotaxis protein